MQDGCHLEDLPICYNRYMILVTGGTGFIGSRIVLRLVQSRFPLKILLRPKKIITQLPHNFALDVVVSSLNDQRSLRAVLSGVDTVLHFASSEHEKPIPDFENVDIKGTNTLVKASVDAGVKKILFISRIGAEKNSVYSLMKAKALAEDAIKSSGLNYLILRLADVFGKNDHFTNELTEFIKAAPGILPLPEGGKTILQPLWIEDLISSIFLIIEDDLFQRTTYLIGGGEFFSFHEIIKMILQRIRKRRILLSMAPAYLRLYNLWLKRSKSKFPLSNEWLDLLAINRTCSIDSLPKTFNLIPARFSHHLDHLE
jgi:NADH dehydrogenase